MRVVLVCPYAWDRFGGVQSHVRALAGSLRGRGHDVAVIAPSLSGSDGEAEDGAILVGRAVPIPANESVAPVAFGRGSATRMGALLEDLKADVVHLHEPLIPSLSLIALRTATAPTVGTFHAAASSSFGYSVSRPVLAKLVSRLGARTAVSEEARALVSRYFPGDYFITPNGVDVRRFSSAEPLDLGPGRIVLFVSRLEPRKGLEVLIRAMSDVGVPEARLVVVGDGRERRKARALAERLGVTATFLGALSEEDLPRAFRAAHVYCAPATGRESFGIVLLEAMAAGTPVVCSDIPGFRKVAESAALFAQPNEPAALAQALRRALTDEPRRKGMREAGKRVAISFDWGRLAAHVEDVYDVAARRR